MRWQPHRAILLALAAAAGAGIALGARAATSSPRAASSSISTTQQSPTTPATTAATTTAATTTATTTTPPPTRSSLAWPGGSGWTDILASIPASAGRAEAVREAHLAAGAGLGGVGVLFSSRYASLRPGYWVVFAGVYGSSAQAQAALAGARARGFATAYPRRVSS